MSNETTQKRSLSVSLGAAFLMATSAIGPGFLTQTSQFTAKYLSSFAFVIVCVIIMDMIAQTNVWSIVGVSGLRGQEIANKVLPGLGYLLVVLVVLGGLAFNIGNVGGVSLGFNAMIGIPEKAGVIIGGVLAICIFLSKKANDIVGKVAQILGGIIIVVMLVVAFMAKPPVGDASISLPLRIPRNSFPSWSRCSAAPAAGTLPFRAHTSCLTRVGAASRKKSSTSASPS